MFRQSRVIIDVKTFVRTVFVGDKFQDRFSDLFGGASMAQIARRLNIPHATVRNYFGGRMPSPEVLIKIADETNVSLNWLLTGRGEMYIGTRPDEDLGRVIDRRIEAIVEQKLSERFTRQMPVQQLGNADGSGFDVENAVRTLDDPHRVMSEWFAHDGREYPQDFGVIFFQGWESFSLEEKLDAVRDAKKVLDRTLDKP